MRNPMARRLLVVLPFSVDCASHASVAVRSAHPRNPESNPSITRRHSEGGEERLSGGEAKMRKNPRGLLGIPRPNISHGLHRLIKGLKTFSQLFVYKEEMEMEMKIGFPTDVKHVTHIGWDGSTTTNPVKGWENLKPPDEVFSFPSSISLKQFEMAMAAQADVSLSANLNNKPF